MSDKGLLAIPQQAEEHSLRLTGRWEVVMARRVAEIWRDGLKGQRK